MKKFIQQFISCVMILALTQTSWADLTLPTEAEEFLKKKPKAPTKNLFEMEQLCRDLEKENFITKDPTTSNLTAWGIPSPSGNGIGMPDHMSDAKREEAARNVFFEKATESALSFLYQQTKSSGRSKKMVQNILSSHKCNTAAVDNLDFKKWGKDSFLNSPTPTMSEMAWNGTILSMYEQVSIKDKGKISYNEILESNKSLGVSDADLLIVANRWKNLGYSDKCGEVITSVQKVCSGETNPRDAFEQMIAENDPELAMGQLVVILGLGLLGYEIYSIGSDALNATYDKAKTAIESKQIADLKQQNADNKKAIEDNNASIKFVESYNNRPAFPGTEKQTEEIKKKTEADAKKWKEQNDQLQAQINKNTETIRKKEPTYDPNKKPDPNKKSGEYEFEIAYEQFVDGIWNPYQKGLMAQYDQCKPDYSKSEMEVASDYVPSTGETCDYEAALGDLMKVGKPNLNQDPNSLPAEPVDMGQQVLEAMQHMPPCNGDPNADPVKCEELTDNYLKQKKFDGGIEEYCLVTNGVGDLCGRRAVKEQMATMAAKAKESGAKPPPATSTFDPEKLMEQALEYGKSASQESQDLTFAQAAREKAAMDYINKRNLAKEYCLKHKLPNCESFGAFR